MKRNVQFLIQKRDGRTEWLRASKIARSMQRACEAAGLVEVDVFDLTAKVMRDLSTRAKLSAKPDADALTTEALTTDAVAVSVTRVLYATGYTHAATCFVVAAHERAARKRALASLRVERNPNDAAPSAEECSPVRFAGAATRDASRPTFFERN